MGGDADLGSRMETVAQRVEYVELLAEDGPLQPRDIVDELPHSRPTVTRALKSLREADLVERREAGYVPTLAGEMAAAEYRRYETASRAILAAEDLLASIPDEHAPPVEVLTDADTVLSEAEVPVRALEAVADRVQRADAVHAYLPTLVNTHLLRVWHRAVVATHLESTGIFDPDLLTVLKGQYSHLLAEMAAGERFSAFSAAGPPYGIFLNASGDEATVVLVVYETETAIAGVLTNDSPAAVAWARDALDRLEAEARDVTGELDALSAAIADGLARPAGGGIATRDAPDGATDVHSLPIDLESEGFVRLSEGYFGSRSSAAPAVSWRTGFTLAEVRAGHAVDRRYGDDQTLTGHLLASLRDGTDHVVLGPPGSGKSTVCMGVACAWDDGDLGTVLYREHGRGDRFGSAALLEAYLRQVDGHALVVVEDATREEANDIFDVIRSFDADPDVSFLLDARTHEWHDADRFDLDPRLDAYRRTAIEETAVPDLDERECERFVGHFADLVEDDLDLSGAELFERVRDGTAGSEGDGLPAGDAIVAQHHIAQRYDPAVEGDSTALDEAVRQTYRTLADDGTELTLDLAGLVALLTAAGVPVAEEYLYAVGDADAFEDVDAAIARMEGRLLFQHAGSRGGSPTEYRTRHETWSTRFLAGIDDVEPAGQTRRRLGRAVTRILALADDPDRRSDIQHHLGGRTPHLHRIEADPRRWADEFIERIFDVGRADASLAPLFGETTDDALELPEACSARTTVQQAAWRGEMYRTHGDLARAEREFRTLGELAESVELPAGGDGPPAEADAEDAAAFRTRWLARSRTNLGLVARDRGDFEAAAEFHREALARFQEIGDREGEASSLKDLGAVTFYRGEFDRAIEYSERALDIARDCDAARIEAACLTNLGAVATRRSDYDAAREHFEQALDIARELDDRYGEASRRSNLGVIAAHEGAYDRARTHCTRSLAIFRDLGDRKRAANSLNNLGEVARKRAAYERAREYHEEALEIRREIGHRSGEATSLVNLGAVALECDDFETAGRRLDEAGDIYEAIDETNGVAEVRYERGRLALARGNVEAAREHARAAADTFADLELPVWRGRALRLRGRVAGADGDPAEARDHLRTAFETFVSVDAAPDAFRALEPLIEVCRDQGDGEDARDWCRRGRDLLADAPDATATRHREWIEDQVAELGDV